MQWFPQTSTAPSMAQETTLASVLRKARFWEAHAGESLNERQRKVVNRLLAGFEGKLTSSKWASLAKMLSGHGQPRHQRSGQTGHPGKGRCWRPEHEQLADRTGGKHRTRAMIACTIWGRRVGQSNAVTNLAQVFALGRTERSSFRTVARARIAARNLL